jgi:hypothetical protein
VTDEDFADVRHICDPYGDDRPPAEDQP